MAFSQYLATKHVALPYVQKHALIKNIKGIMNFWTCAMKIPSDAFEGYKDNLSILH